MYNELNVKYTTLNAVRRYINVPVPSRKMRSDRTSWMTNEIEKLNFHRDYLKKKAAMLQTLLHEQTLLRFTLRIKRVETKLLNSLATQKLNTSKPILRAVKIPEKTGTS